MRGVVLPGPQMAPALPRSWLLQPYAPVRLLEIALCQLGGEFWSTESVSEIRIGVVFTHERGLRWRLRVGLGAATEVSSVVPGYK